MVVLWSLSAILSGLHNLAKAETWGQLPLDTSVGYIAWVEPT